MSDFGLRIFIRVSVQPPLNNSCNSCNSCKTVAVQSSFPSFASARIVRICVHPCSSVAKTQFVPPPRRRGAEEKKQNRNPENPVPFSGRMDFSGPLALCCPIRIYFGFRILSRVHPWL